MMSKGKVEALEDILIDKFSDLTKVGTRLILLLVCNIGVMVGLFANLYYTIYQYVEGVDASGYSLLMLLLLAVITFILSKYSDKFIDKAETLMKEIKNN